MTKTAIVIVQLNTKHQMEIIFSFLNNRLTAILNNQLFYTKAVISLVVWIKLKYMYLFIKQPPKSKSNPNGLTGENLGVFFKQKLTKNRMEAAIKTGHIIPINQDQWKQLN